MLYLTIIKEKLPTMFASHTAAAPGDSRAAYSITGDFLQFFHSKIQSPPFSGFKYQDKPMRQSPLFSDEAFKQSIVKLATSVWLIHKLSLSFEPTADIFHVPPGSDFDGDYMVDGAEAGSSDEIDHRNAAHRRRNVVLMCTPGFVVRNTIIKSRVICLMGDAKVVVALYLGTTFSGLAFAKRSEPDRVEPFVDWPNREANSKPHWRCIRNTCDWGGVLNNDSDVMKLLQQNSAEYHLTRFKLILSKGHKSEQPELGVNYLQELSRSAREHLRRNFGNHLNMKDTQWCVTVPRIWDEDARQMMKNCAWKAGMVIHSDPTAPRADLVLSANASPFPLHIIHEEEAAFLYCKRTSMANLVLSKGDKIMVADVGWRAINVSVQQKVRDDPNGLHVEEVTPSYGELGGGSFVDDNFYTFMNDKIGCFRKFGNAKPMQMWWREVMKFDGHEDAVAVEFDLPEDLQTAWRAYDEKEHAKCMKDSPNAYKKVRLECSALKAIFDPEVDKVLNLIGRHVNGVRVLMLVGGFSESPYLRKRIEERFKAMVEKVIFPPEPAMAIC